MAPLVAARKCAVVLMHMRGGPADHMKFAHYRDVVGEVESLPRSACARRDPRGRRPARVSSSTPAWVSPRPARHSLALLDALPRLCALGYPVLVGASRKAFVRATAGADPAAIESATAAVSAIAIAAGVAIVRVHDVGFGGGGGEDGGGDQILPMGAASPNPRWSNT